LLRAYKGGSQTGESTFIHFRIAIVKPCCGDEIEGSIPKKFQPLIIFESIRVLVQI
jgi:hypothetical protein